MTLFTSLGTLESAGLIQVAKVEPDLEYLFRHSLVQDAAYASLIESDRKRLHLAVGDAIEKLYPDRKRELAAILGYHFKEGGQEERALPYFIIAGDEALSVYANQEAEVQYRRALDLVCCSGSFIAWIYSGLGEAMYRQSRMDEALQAIQNGINVYKSLGESEGIARLYARLARVKWFAGDRPEGLRICLEGMELVKDAPNSVGKAALMHETARAYYFNGMSDESLSLCRQALALAEQLDAVNVQADALATLGILPGISSEESLEALQKATDLAEEKRLLQIAMRAHQNLGTMIRAWNADNESALKHFKRSAELGKLRGVASEEVIGLSSYASALISTGRLREVEAEITRLEELAGNISDPMPTLISIKFLKGFLIGLKGDWDEGITIIREVLQIWQKLVNLESEIGALDQLTWMLLEKNRWENLDDFNEIETLMQRAVLIAEEYPSFAPMWVYPRMSILRARQGDPEQARQWLEKIKQTALAGNSGWAEWFNLECGIEIARSEHDWNLALDLIEQLANLQKRLGFMGNWAVSLIDWADLLQHRGESGDLEKAQSVLRPGLEVANETGVAYFGRIGQELLERIQNKLHAQVIGAEQMTRELKKARQVQESLLPERPPDIPGWGLEVVLKPAHETSGDFYDYLPLSQGKLGLVIADVTDKGTSAALYMALSRSLWRTFALNHPGEPELTMGETNQRILADTHGGLFITLFYGILNPADGQLLYSNAGHLPALLLRAKNGAVEKLARTGIPLGVFDEANWNRQSVFIEPGDALVLYTDGITDAENSAQEFFGLDRLEATIKRFHGRQSTELHQGLLKEVHDWMGNTAQTDDITLMVVVREK